MKYDDHTDACPICTVGLDTGQGCDCPEPLCVRCHRAYHVELLNWGAPGWMGGVA